MTITPTPPVPALASEVQEAIAAAKEVAKGTIVTEQLKRPHPIVANWLVEHQEHKRRHRQDRSPYRAALQDWTESDLRQHRILDTIFRTVDQTGLSVISESHGTFHFIYEREKISCRFREKNRQVRRPKTDRERRWSLPGDKDWKQDLEPTGNLVFTLEDYFGPEHGIRREWLETDTKRLEGMIEDIIATLLGAGPVLVRMREEREEQSRKRADAERQRQEEQARRRKDRNQWRGFIEQSERYETAIRARQLIDALERSAADLDKTVGEKTLAEWLEWARDQADALDPLRRGPDDVLLEISKISEWTYRD